MPSGWARSTVTTRSSRASRSRFVGRRSPGSSYSSRSVTGPPGAGGSRDRRRDRVGLVALDRDHRRPQPPLQAVLDDAAAMAADAARDPADLAVGEHPVVELAAPRREVVVADEMGNG